MYIFVSKFRLLEFRLLLSRVAPYHELFGHFALILDKKKVLPHSNVICLCYKLMGISKEVSPIAVISRVSC